MTTEEFEQIEELYIKYQNAVTNKKEAGERVVARYTTLEDFDSYEHWCAEAAKLGEALLKKVPLLLAEITALRYKSTKEVKPLRR